MKSLSLKFSITCRHCSRPLPVNRAAESILCLQCMAHTDTPVELWESLVTPQLMTAAALESGTDSWANGLLAGIGSYALVFGHQDPRCGGCGGIWDAGALLKILEDGGSHFTCTECGKAWSVRTPPDWFGRITPFARMLVGETAAGAQEESFRGETGISIYCYHCGGSLPLDGSSKTVPCTYCGNILLVPDDVWLRLHPVDIPRTWYIILDLDDDAVLLPYDIDELIDLAGMPDDGTALLWEDDNGCCLGRVDKTGLFRWLERDLSCSGYARLFYVPGSDTLWILDHDEELVYAFNAERGARVRTIGNEDGDPGLVSVLDHYHAAACHDNTLLVNRRWEEDTSPENITERIRRVGPHTLTPDEIERLNQKSGLSGMRRFSEKGKRIPLWPGRNDDELDRTIPRWNAMPDYPARPPEDALLEAGPDGTLYMIDPLKAIVARYDRDGKFLGLIQPEQNAVSAIEDCGVAGDGALVIVFNHRKKIGKEEWPHIARIELDGTFGILAGPHAPVHNYSIGSWVKRISAAPRGSIHVCAYKFKDLRVLNPDGSTLWKGLWTSEYDKSLAGELEEARGKKS